MMPPQVTELVTDKVVEVASPEDVNSQNTGLVLSITPTVLISLELKAGDLQDEYVILLSTE